MTIAIWVNYQGFAIKKVLQENFQNINFLDIPLIFTILNNEDVKEIIFQKLHNSYLEIIEIYYTFYESIDTDILKWNLYNTNDTMVKYIINNSER